METFSRPQDFKMVIDRLDKIENVISSKQMHLGDHFLDNQEFLQLMHISKRTAQNWRDDGVIPFSQIGYKIYYRMSDIQNLLDRNYQAPRKSFSNSKNVGYEFAK
ncbi:helix-turn-helix domain-containing protein [Panacibacter ginsenosidivorans]|uniref:Helix-turn-helix domain-containing protein n=1 Tax=Panacibacter ginsenosidivorans TaxID=1813871 RepID=A0A5B8VB68_9BACT|nr:helix-turn-helix domain-containing protein [Panacibacter ginsenosidivorans]QEC68747.1 helix-turn-helix domain-containing protein [Panacibacter ginsenosidivorans]